MPIGMIQSDKETAAYITSSWPWLADQIAWAIATERERCARVADAVASNAERRADGHTALDAIASAKDKQHTAEEIASKIRGGS